MRKKNEKRKVNYSKQFNKNLVKAPLKIQKAFRHRRTLFEVDPFHPLLKNHPLAGDYASHRSINVTGDWRAVYREEDGSILFTDLGTHSQLYS